MTDVSEMLAASIIRVITLMMKADFYQSTWYNFPKFILKSAGKQVHTG
jgi:hypothetical protein